MQAVSPSTSFPSTFRLYVPESSFSADGKATYRFRYGKEKINIIRSIDLLVIDENQQGPRRLARFGGCRLEAAPATGTNPLAACNC